MNGRKGTLCEDLLVVRKLLWGHPGRDARLWILTVVSLLVSLEAGCVTTGGNLKKPLASAVLTSTHYGKWGITGLEQGDLLKFLVSLLVSLVGWF